MSADTPLVAVTTTSRGPYVDAAIARLERSGFAVRRVAGLSSRSTPEDIVRAVSGAWGIIASTEPYSRSVLSSLGELRVIARPGVGYDSIDVGSAAEAGIVVFTTPGINHNAVADYSVGLMLATTYRIAESDRIVRARGWVTPGTSRELNGATVGIVGLGRVGCAVVERLTGFQCQIVATEPRPLKTFVEAHSIRLVGLDELLRSVDVVSLHVPLDSSTHHLIGSEELAAMKRDAILINTSRGSIVDESALVAALRSDSIRGAGLDVFEVEPLPPTSPLVGIENVVLSAHIASHAARTLNEMMQAAVDGIVDVWQGRLPPGRVLPADVSG